MSDNETAPDQGANVEGGVLDALVGEGKKYASLEELAKGKAEADSFIDKLKDENSDLRKQAEEKTTIMDLMEAFKSLNQEQESNSESVTPLDDEVLQGKLEQMIKEREAKRTSEANRTEAMKLVSDKLNGDEKAVELFVQQKATQLGMDASKLWSLSDESPAGFAQIIGLESQPTQQVTPMSLPHQNTEATTGGTSMEVDGFKTKNWFDQQRREMGNKKFINSSTIQRRMIESREKLGDRFYS